jgi:hypothetical protein
MVTHPCPSSKQDPSLYFILLITATAARSMKVLLQDFFKLYRKLLYRKSNSTPNILQLIASMVT